MQKANFSLQVVPETDPVKSINAHYMNYPADSLQHTGSQDKNKIPASKICNMSTYDKGAELAGISEAHRHFMNPNKVSSTTNVNGKDQKINLKSNNFEIGENNVGHYSTINNVQYPIQK